MRDSEIIAAPAGVGRWQGAPLALSAEFYDDDPMTLLALAWIDAGMRAPVATSPLTETGCEVPGCSSRSIVFIKTHFGPVQVCRLHFESVKRTVQAIPDRPAGF